MHLFFIQQGMGGTLFYPGIRGIQRKWLCRGIPVLSNRVSLPLFHQRVIKDTPFHLTGLVGGGVYLFSPQYIYAATQKSEIFETRKNVHGLRRTVTFAHCEHWNSITLICWINCFQTRTVGRMWCTSGSWTTGDRSPPRAAYSSLSSNSSITSRRRSTSPTL